MPSYKDMEIGGEYNWETLNISPEEFTITELNNPEVEDTLAKSTSLGLASTVNQTLASKMNSKASEMPKKIVENYENKVTT